MARINAEIADSDGESESDGDVVSRFNHTQSWATLDEDKLPVIDIEVNFDEFLGKSQEYNIDGLRQISSRNEGRKESSKSTSTASLGQQIQCEQEKLAQKKSSDGTGPSHENSRLGPPSSSSLTMATMRRCHSMLPAGPHMDGLRDTSRKRQKTYGGSGSSRIRSNESDAFLDQPCKQDRKNAANPTAIYDHNGPPEAEGQGPGLGDMSAFSADGGYWKQDLTHPSQSKVRSDISKEHENHTLDQKCSDVNHSAFNNHLRAPAGRVSTSRSLMGNHESIHLDFGANGTGLDIDTNPFGIPSQQSVGEGDERTDLKTPQGTYQQPSDPMIGAPSILGHRDIFQGNPSEDPHHFAEDMDPHGTMYGRHTLGRSRSYVDPVLLVKDPALDARETYGKASALSRKRRKTDNGFSLAITSGVNEINAPLSATVAREKSPGIERQAKKRGRKPKNPSIMSRNDGDCEPGHEAQELIAKPITIETDSPANRLSSESHLDDESTVGLPLEQYKPRPSRSRSKMVSKQQKPGSLEGSPQRIQTPIDEGQPPTAAGNYGMEEPEHTPLTKLKKEKKKKNKMKRAKTSAAALLKKSEKMLSDGEEDVVWVESKPASVKMQVPNPLESKIEEEQMKDEPPASVCQDSRQAIDVDLIRTKRRSVDDDEPEGVAEMAVEAPLPPEPKTQPPKRRGRKKKADAVEGNHDDEATEPDDAAAALKLPNGLASETRIDTTSTAVQPCREPDTELSTPIEVLKEKSNNIPHNPHHHKEKDAIDNAADSITPSPSKPTTADAIIPAPSLPATPLQDKPANSTTATIAMTPTSMTSEKGPTKHSPINPAGGTVKYRVGLSRRAAIPPLLKIVRK